MKKCPLCGQVYDDIYNKCRDGTRLIQADESAPATPIGGLANVPPQAAGPSLPKVAEIDVRARARRQPTSRPSDSKKSQPQPKSSSSRPLAVAGRILVILFLFACLLEWIKSQGQRSHDQEKQATQLAQANAQIREETQQMLKATNTAQALSILQGLGRTFESTAAASSGQPKGIVEVFARFTKKVASVQANLATGVNLMSQGMDMTDVETPEQFQAKKTKVFLACDMIEAVGAFEKNAVEGFRTELQTAHYPAQATQAFMANQQTNQNFILIGKHGQCLFEYTETRKAMAKLLEASWGKWTFHKDSQTFTFTDAAFSADYKAALLACNAADARANAIDAQQRMAAKNMAAP